MKLTFYRVTHGILLFTPEKFRGTKELAAIQRFTDNYALHKNVNLATSLLYIHVT
jgi:hypothetical protein